MGSNRLTHFPPLSLYPSISTDRQNDRAKAAAAAAHPEAAKAGTLGILDAIESRGAPGEPTSRMLKEAAKQQQFRQYNNNNQQESHHNIHGPSRI